jgi:hypothetical protein
MIMTHQRTSIKALKLFLKIKKNLGWAGYVAQVVEHLASKFKAQYCQKQQQQQNNK